MTLQGPETHLDRQGILKKAALDTKDIKTGPLLPVLALSGLPVNFDFPKKQANFDIPMPNLGHVGPI